jgi:hypothetical protein
MIARGFHTAAVSAQDASFMIEASRFTAGGSGRDATIVTREARHRASHAGQ